MQQYIHQMTNEYLTICSQFLLLDTYTWFIFWDRLYIWTKCGTEQKGQAETSPIYRLTLWLGD